MPSGSGTRKFLDAQAPLPPGTTPATAASPSGAVSQSATSLPSEVPDLVVPNPDMPATPVTQRPGMRS